MLTIVTSSFPSAVSPIEKTLSPSDCYLHDAVKMLQNIQSTVEALSKRDVSPISSSDIHRRYTQCYFV